MTIAILPPIIRANIITLSGLDEPVDPSESFEMMLISLCRVFDIVTSRGADFGTGIGVALEQVMTPDGFRYKDDDQEWVKTHFGVTNDY